MKLSIGFLLQCSFFFVTFCKATEPTVSSGFFFNFTDCGDENRMVKFSASVTPFPALFSNVQINLWLGGRVEFTEKAGNFARNVSVDQLIENVRADIFVDPDSNPIFNYISKFNNTKMCVDSGKQIVAREFFQALHSAMLAPLNSTAALFPIDINELNNILLYRMWIILKSLPTPISGQVRANIKYFDTTVFCLQWNVKTDTIGKHTECDKQRHNFAAAFLTPKVADINNRDQLICPLNSMAQLNQSDCLCNFPHSGPYCMFQCNFDQVRPANAPCSLDYEGPEGCSFTSLDYSKMCLLRQNVTLLDGEIVAQADDFSSILVRWQMKNYFIMGPYVGKFDIYNANDGQHLGFFTKRLSYSEGQVSELNLTALRYSEDGDLFNLALQSYTIYTLKISLRSTAILDNQIVYIDAGTKNFDTSEDIPKKPKVFEAKIANETHMEIDWSLVGEHCPGMITHYDTRLWCSKDSHLVFDYNVTLRTPFNCRESASYPYLYSSLGKNCDGGTFNVKLRVATKIGYGDWSDVHSVNVPGKGLSQWQIAAISISAVVVATVILTAIFLYYYKTRVTSYIKSHNHLIWRRSMPLPELPQSSSDDTISQTTEYASSQFNYVPSSEVSNYIVLEQEEPYSMPSTGTIPTSSDEYPQTGSSVSQEYIYTEIRK